MLKQLGVRHFKSWEQIENMAIAPITGLFGTNSSGKSSILQLLLMLKQTVESSDRAQVLDCGDENSLANLGSFSEMIYGHDRDNELRFHLAWTLPKQLTVKDPSQKGQSLFAADQIEFECALGANGTDRLAVSEVCYRVANERFHMRRKEDKKVKYELISEDGYRFVRTQGRPWDLPAPVKFYGFPDQVYAYYQNASFLSDLQLELEGLFSRIFYLGPLREFPSDSTRGRDRNRLTWAGGVNVWWMRFWPPVTRAEQSLRVTGESA
jgi:hypothetical protein